MRAVIRNSLYPECTLIILKLIIKSSLNGLAFFLLIKTQRILTLVALVATNKWVPFFNHVLYCNCITPLPPPPQSITDHFNRSFAKSLFLAIFCSNHKTSPQLTDEIYLSKARFCSLARLLNLPFVSHGWLIFFRRKCSTLICGLVI